MTAAQRLERIAQGESARLEFKSSFQKDAIQTRTGFANSQGGTVLVGVTDAGAVSGVTVGKETLNEWLGQIKSSTSPALIPDIATHTAQGKTVVAIRMDEFPVKPVNTKGRYFKRVASANHQFSSGEIADLYTQSLQLSWDAYEARGYAVGQLSATKIQRFLRLVNQHGRFAVDESDPHAALQKLQYLKNDQPTWAAILLFAEDPIRHNVHIGRFKTPDMIIDDRQFTDTLFEVVEQSMKFLVSHISVAFEFDGSIQRKERFDYPLAALRETLVNAVVHRSYTDPNDIQIKIFDDKITIFSPGTFYGNISVADIQTDNYRSSLRNKLVAEGFYLINAIEKYGSGFIRIRRAMQDYPEIQFDVQEFQGGVMAVFTHKSGQAQYATPQVTEHPQDEGLNEGLNSLFAHIAQEPGQRTPALAKTLNTSAKNIERWLQQLKAQGLVEFRGSKKTGGYHPVQLQNNNAQPAP